MSVAQTEDKHEHAKRNAANWLGIIRDWRLKLDDDRREVRIAELEEMIETFEHGDPDKLSAQDYVAAKKELEELQSFGRAEDDALREEIEQSPLSIQVRSGWVSIGEKMEAEEAEILLSTGGPALRVLVDLDSFSPHSVKLQWQDWFTPWTDYYEEDVEELLAWFAGFFYYGE